MPESKSNAVVEDVILGNYPAVEVESKNDTVIELDRELRNESEIQTLKEQIAKLTNQPAPMREMTPGPAAIKRRMLLQDKVKELKRGTRREGDYWFGECVPFTVVNFNPIPLSLQGELSDQHIPAADSPISKKLRFPFNGRLFVGSYVTLWNPKVWAVVIGTENIKGADVPQHRADYLAPIGIAHQFWEHYVEGAIDAIGMGGILIFEGDTKSLEATKLEGNKGKIRIPVIDAANSTIAKPSYTVEEKPLRDVLEATLIRQRRYAEFQIAEGHRLAHSPNVEEQKQRTERHTMWHNWAMAMGYKSVPEDWASEMLNDSPDNKAVLCSCGSRQEKPDQHFCKNCNAPFNPLKTFLAGLPVPEVWLTRYEGAEWDQIMVETEKRKKKAALLNPPAEDAAEKKKAKS